VAELVVRDKRSLQTERGLPQWLDRVSPSTQETHKAHNIHTCVCVCVCFTLRHYKPQTPYRVHLYFFILQFICRALTVGWGAGGQSIYFCCQLAISQSAHTHTLWLEMPIPATCVHRVDETSHKGSFSNRRRYNSVL